MTLISGHFLTGIITLRDWVEPFRKLSLFQLPFKDAQTLCLESSILTGCTRRSWRKMTL